MLFHGFGMGVVIESLKKARVCIHKRGTQVDQTEVELHRQRADRDLPFDEFSLSSRTAIRYSIVICWQRIR